MTEPGSILIEMVPAGHAFEIIAIDSETGREVRFIAPQSASETEIKALARAKLQFVQRRENQIQEQGRDNQAVRKDGRRGIIV